jgi:RHS repeat-associated protein
MATTSVQYTYVSPGVIDVTDATGAKTRLQFTGTGQLQSIQDPLNRSTQFAYDGNGYLSQITAPGNAIYRYSYDSQGRLLSQVDPANQSIAFTYGANSNAPTAVRDAKGQTTQYTYNAHGELTGITYLDGQSETYTYDLSGRLRQVKERSGDTFTYTYNSVGRITRKDFGDGTYERFTYDSAGRVATVRDVRGGTTTLTYDTNNRLTKIAYPGARFLSFTYDAVGRRTQMQDQTGFTTNYSYDAEGRLSELKNASGTRIVAYTYDGLSRLSRETNGNGTYTTYGYDSAGQVTTINNYAPNGTVNSFFQYTYNTLGQQTSANTRDGKWTYTYDATGQLTRGQFASTNASIANQDLRYVYDAAGNRIRTVINGVTTNYAANNLNQYTTVGGATQTYDADGNLIQVVNGTQTTTYTYNQRNQLIGATTPEGTFTYEYDAFGNRVASTKNGVRTEFLVDPFGLGDVVGEYSSSAATNYVHGLGLVGRFAGTNAAYYDSDLLGSTAGLTNSTGSYVNRYAYRPYGENLLSTEGIANSFEFVGQWGLTNENYGLSFVRARYYSPSIGRFASPDATGQNGGVNLYGYSLNSPSNFIDIDGETPATVIKFLAPLAIKYLRSISKTSPRRVEPVKKIEKIEKIEGGAFPPVSRENGSRTKLVQGPDGKWFVQDSSGNQVIGGLASGGIGLGLLLGSGNDAQAASSGGRDGGGSPWGGEENPPKNPNDPPKDPPIPPGPPASPEDPPPPSGPGSGAGGGMGQGKNSVSPLVLDLDGDGIELSVLAESSAFFDLDADRFAEQTGWVKADDGLLAIDKNGDRRINDINELFGNATTDGFVVLKQLDSNNDNLIDSRDAQFSKLLIWRDYNQDGFSNVGELRSLADWGIRSISLNAQTAGYFLQGNRISSTSSYTLTNGTTRQIVDAWFTNDQINTIYDRDYQLKAETLFLPSLRGNGELANLYIAMSNDPTLLGLMRNFVALTPGTNWDSFSRQVTTQATAILYRWAGVENGGSRGYMNDGRNLYFMEKYTGAPFVQVLLDGSTDPDPRWNAAAVLNPTWDKLLQQLLGRLLVQGPMRQFFPNVVFSHNQDSLISSASLDTVLTNLSTNRPTNFDAALRYWNLAILGLDAFEDRFGLSQSDYDARISQTLATANNFGTYLSLLRKPDFLTTIAAPVNGTAANNNFAGTTGNDTYNSGRGNDTVNGAAGNDTLDGSFGNDTVNGGDGNDSIRGGLDVDNLNGGNGIDTLALELSTSTNLTITNPRNGINIAGLITATNFEIFKITTGSGNDTMTQSALVNGVVFRSDDTLNGGAGNDTLNPGLGQQDQVIGAAGDDLLILDYSLGDTGRGMTVEVSSVTAEGAAGSAGRFAGDYSWLDSMAFSGIDRFQLTATQQDDTIEVAGRGTVNSGAGNDTITVQSTNFTINGGVGEDILIVDLSPRIDNLNFTIGYTGITGQPLFLSNIETIDFYSGVGNDTINFVSSTTPTLLRGGSGSDVLTTGAGSRDRLEGNDGDDILRSGDGDDGGFWAFLRYNQAGLLGGTGNDQLFGEGGNDDLFGEEGNDQLDGGIGNDSLYGGNGNDTLNAGDGDDFLDPGSGVDQSIGGLGTDVLRLDYSTATTPISITYTNTTTGTLSGGGTFREVEGLDLLGGSGTDTFNVTATTYKSWIRSGAGSDTVNAGSGDDRLEGGDGDDILRGGAGNETGYNWYFTFGSNYLEAGLYGGNGNDQLFGESGNDNLFGEAGNDTLNGGDGDDFLDPGSGVNQSIGGLGTDILRLDYSTATTPISITYTTTTTGTLSGGSTFRDIEGFDLLGGSGNDNFNITAAIYKSWIRSSAGNDTVNAGSGDDRLEGGDGDDILRGGAGNENGYNWYFTFGTTYLEAGLYGGNGNDQLFGESGNDQLFGEAGNDILNGGLGDDILNGGAGIDRFVFDINAAFSTTIGVDAIADFTIGTDKIVLDKTTFTALTSAAGNGFTVSNEFARVTTDDAVATNAARIVYNSSNGKLFYNQNSTAAGLGTGSQFATLTSNPLLTALDFVIQA